MSQRGQHRRSGQPHPGSRHIGLLLFDGVEELDAVGPWEVLALLDPAAPRGRLGRLVPLGATVSRSPPPRASSLGAHHSWEDAPTMDVLIHPGGIGTRRS